MRAKCSKREYYCPTQNTEVEIEVLETPIRTLGAPREQYKYFMNYCDYAEANGCYMYCNCPFISQK